MADGITPQEKARRARVMRRASRAKQQTKDSQNATKAANDIAASGFSLPQIISCVHRGGKIGTVAKASKGGG